jgi:hypothetical protein
MFSFPYGNKEAKVSEKDNSFMLQEENFILIKILEVLLENCY